MATKIPTTAIATNSSMRVKPLAAILNILFTQVCLCPLGQSRVLPKG